MRHRRGRPVRRLDRLVDGGDGGRGACRRDGAGAVGLGRRGRCRRAGGAAGRRPRDRLGGRAPTRPSRCARWGRTSCSATATSPVAEAVAEATAGRGVDAVVDTTGGPRFGEHLAAMAPDGRLVTCGAHAGEVVPLDIIELFRHGHRILGFRVATPGRDPRVARDGARRPDQRAGRPHLPAAPRRPPRTPTWTSAATSARSCWWPDDPRLLLPRPLPAERERQGRRGRPLPRRLRPRCCRCCASTAPSIRQMPCPELAFGGTRRFWAVREQYDTPAFRAPLPAAGRAGGSAGAGRPGGRRAGGHHRHRRQPQHGRRADRRRRRLGRPPGQAERRGLPGHARPRPVHRDAAGAAGRRRGRGARVVGIGQDLFDYDEQRELAKLAGVSPATGARDAR